MLHKIERNQKFTEMDLDKVMVFCILDTAVPYEKVCQAYDALDKQGLTTRIGLGSIFSEDIKEVLESVGYRWANQKSRYLKEFAFNGIDLSTATREEIVKSIKGVGMKLASLFIRTTRGDQIAVLDVHTLRWLQKRASIPDDKFKKMSYEKKEELFKSAAELMGKTVTELDIKIWEENRIGNR